MSPSFVKHEQSNSISSEPIHQKQPQSKSIQQEQPKSISPEPIEPKHPQPQVVSRIVEKPSSPLPAFTKVPEAPKQEPEGVPLWLYGAIALGFATSSVLIYKSLPHQPQSRKPRKRVRVKLETSPTATIRKKRQHPPQKQRRRVPPDAGLTHMVGSQPATVKKPLVTVLSPEESHPLDLGDNNLADMLDMRKRYSLTALLNKE
jgi:hypothetical protein